MELKSLKIKDSKALELPRASCIWFVFSPRSTSAPLPAFVQSVDWSMKGAISKLRLSGRDLKTPTFIPTLGRMEASLLILQAANAPSELGAGFTAIENLGFRQAVVWMEEDSLRSDWEKDLETRGSSVIEELLTVHS